MSRKKDKKKEAKQEAGEVVPLTPEMGGGCWPPLFAFAVSIVVFVALILPAVQALRIADKWAALLALGGWGACFFLLLPLFVRWAARTPTSETEEGS